MYQLTNDIIERIFEVLIMILGIDKKKKKPYVARHWSIDNHFGRAHEGGITPEKVAYDDGNSLLNSLYFYQRRTNFERELLDRTPNEVIDFCRRWFWEDLLLFIKNPVQIEYLFSAIDNAIYAGKSRRQITMEEYRERLCNLPEKDIGKLVLDKIKQLPLYELFLSIRIFFIPETTRRIKND